MHALLDTLRACVPLLPVPFVAEHRRLFAEEHLTKLAARLLEFHRHSVPTQLPPPHFAAECTPPLDEAFSPFREPLRAWAAAPDESAPEVVRQLARAVLAAGCDGLLLLLGQRRTPASLTDARAIPPLRAELLASAAALHNSADGLTVAARALTKHVPRSPDDFWGALSGTVVEKNAAARAILEGILDGQTWWNVFGHFQHGTVYEARVSSGHGARWGAGGAPFIGFLGPFEEGPLGLTPRR
jgi:hypothetical protein